MGKTINPVQLKNTVQEVIKICLCMIVKNEEHILARSSLPCAAAFCDAYCVDDTGSTDGTKDLIFNFFKERNIPGVIIDTPWTKKFDINRTINLRNAEKYVESIRKEGEIWYMFFMDADDLIYGGDPLDFNYGEGGYEAPALPHISKPEDNLPGNYPAFPVNKAKLLKEKPSPNYVNYAE